MLNIVIPMAGLGSRFKNAGFQDPKPLIAIHGIPMVRWVIHNLTPKVAHRFIFIGQREHNQAYGLEEKLTAWAKHVEFVWLDGLTEGAACTVLAAKSLINNDDALMIANSDQYIDADINDYLAQLETSDLDGLIMTLHANDPKWSYVALNEQGLVTKVAEKQVISNEATVGIYNFKKGRDFVSAAEQMIAQNLRVNGEFYVAPVYNIMLEKHKKIGIYNIGAEARGMYGLGIPADLALFISLPLSKQVSKQII